ncbi:hypothetical protein C7I87_00605 [Mesorhizobium sp. SARCC-RB16n]|nr:hypothetical protein C7I87_00605 [Mesorhizobium sp. SARCC-RB16n]
MALGFICWVAFLCPPAHSEENHQAPRKCLLDVSKADSPTPFFIPCAKAEPSVLPMVWYWEGQEV